MDTNTETLYNYLHNLHALDRTSLLYDINKSALQIIKHHGYPSKKDEKWKYIDIKKYIDKILSDNNSTPKQYVNNKVSIETEYKSKNTILISNGTIDADININGLNINIGTKSEKASDLDNDFIKTLNFASIYNIIDISITESLKEPLYIMHSFGDCNTLTSYKVNINIAKDIYVPIVELFVSDDDTSKIVTYDLTINLDDRAKLDNYRFNNIYSPFIFLNNLDCRISKEAEFTNVNICAGKSDLIKNHINCYLNGELASVNLYGLNFIKENSVVDNQTAVFHNVSNCTSNELYKYINKDNSSGIFNGKIFVAKDAQQTQAFQQNKNILLSSSATMHSQPQLEIFANDVKCSHGCTIGQLDNESIFYLKTRGFSQDDAKNILLEAFISDILETIKLKDLQNIIHKNLYL